MQMSEWQAIARMLLTGNLFRKVSERLTSRGMCTTTNIAGLIAKRDTTSLSAGHRRTANHKRVDSIAVKQQKMQRR
jgi:hypothetical protein